ncbi:MAG: hypothetical protein AB7O78_04310 [Thermoleophilia bacterium]
MTPPTDDITFEFCLRSVGWADARLEIGANATEMTPSYLTDALGDLLRAVLTLTEGGSPASLTWDEEGWWDYWSLVLDGDRVDLVLEFEREGANDFHPPLSGTVQLTALVRVVVDAARGILDHHGEAGYLAQWAEHPFPVAELRALEKWRALHP